MSVTPFDSELVSTLRNLLRRAESGEIVVLVGVAAMRLLDAAGSRWEMIDGGTDLDSERVGAIGALHILLDQLSEDARRAADEEA